MLGSALTRLQRCGSTFGATICRPTVSTVRPGQSCITSSLRTRASSLNWEVTIAAPEVRKTTSVGTAPCLAISSPLKNVLQPTRPVSVCSALALAGFVLNARHSRL